MWHNQVARYLLYRAMKNRNKTATALDGAIKVHCVREVRLP